MIRPWQIWNDAIDTRRRVCLYSRRVGALSCPFMSRDRKPSAMIESPFPEYIGFAVKTMDSLEGFALSPQEGQILGPRAVKKRRDEFLLGRAAGNSAMKQVGIASPPPVLKGPQNEPLWPPGYVGAITHSAGVAVGAVCPAKMAAGIGVDIELLDRDVSPGVFRMVCTEEEKVFLDRCGSDAQLMFKRLFSAKEAAFKAFFPHAQRYIGYKEASFAWDPEQGCFLAKLVERVSSLYPAGYRFQVGSSDQERFTFSHILLPPAPQSSSQ